MIDLCALAIGIVVQAPEVWLVHKIEKNIQGAQYRIAAPSDSSRLFYETREGNWFGPIEHYWVGIDPPIDGDVYGIACTADGTYMLISEIDPVEYPGVPMVIPGNFKHNSLEVTLIHQHGQVLGKISDSNYFPKHMLDNQYFVRTEFPDHSVVVNRFLTVSSSGGNEDEDVLFTPIDGVKGAYPCTDVFFYVSSPFIGLMDSTGHYLTEPKWRAIRNHGEGYFSAYRQDRSIDVIRCDGEILFTLSAGSFLSCRTADGFAAVVIDEHKNQQGVLFNLDGEVLGQHPFGIEMTSLPANLHLSYGYSDQDHESPVLWNNKTRELVSLPFKLSIIEFPEDQSGVFQFTRKPDSKKTNTREIVGLMNPDGSVRFQMRSTLEPRIRWEHVGSIVRGAAMYQAYHHQDSTTHEYLINKDGQVLWKSPDAPNPEIEFMNIEN